MDYFLTVRRFAACTLFGLAGSAIAQTVAAPGEAVAAPYRWRLELSPYTTHFSYNVEHRHVILAGLERESTADNRFVGLALFSNSFGQESGYLYMGKSYYNVVESLPQLYLKISAGVLYGYKAPFNHKVPLNYKGFSPGIIPAAGWHFGSGWNAQIDLLGTAGLTYSLVKEF
jgi:hypothetical protein